MQFRSVLSAAKANKNGTPDLHGDVAKCKQQAVFSKGIGNGNGQAHPQQHQYKEHQSNGNGLRVQPVGDPGGEDPHPPDGQYHQQTLVDPVRGEMGNQQVSTLCNCVDEDQIKEQLGERDLVF